MHRLTAWREELSARPEWWVVVTGFAAWGWLLRDGLQRFSHAVHHDAGFAAELLRWQVMVLAMMLPILTMKARDVALRCLVDRRHPAIATFLIGYLAPWSVFGAMAIALRPWLPFEPPFLTAALCAIAAAWAMCPPRENAMMSVYTYAPIIAPDGWQATRDCAAAGVAVGWTCVISCWPLMLACLASGHDLVVMAVGGALGVIESRSFRSPRRLVIGASGALMLLVLLVD